MAAIMIGAFSAVAAAPPASAAPMIICKSSPVPPGFVITAQGTSLSCPGGINNTWSITVPPTTGFTIICSVSPIPPGFVITSQSFSVFCPGGLNNTFTIHFA